MQVSNTRRLCIVELIVQNLGIQAEVCWSYTGDLHLRALQPQSTEDDQIFLLLMERFSFMCISDLVNVGKLYYNEQAPAEVLLSSFGYQSWPV